MNILGIGDHVSCGAAICAMASSRRWSSMKGLVREKMVFGVPVEGIAENAAEELRGLQPADIDAVAVARPSTST